MFFTTLWPLKERTFIDPMSSTCHTTISHPYLQLISNSLAEYAHQTGIDLSQNPFAEKFQQSIAPDAILELLQEREKAFKEYRDGNRRLINCLSPAVSILHAFSGLLGEAGNLVSDSVLHFSYRVVTQLCQFPFPPIKAVIVGIDVLLDACPFNIDSNQFSSHV
jgi:hypothetical protein